MDIDQMRRKAVSNWPSRIFAIPAGQCAIKGELIPPSCCQCLYSRNGVLLDVGPSTTIADVCISRTRHHTLPLPNWKTVACLFRDHLSGWEVICG